MLQPTFSGLQFEAGCDEAGRGCLAGPVYASAVILPVGYSNPILNDSKKLSAIQRALLRDEIEKHALAWAVAAVDNHIIDQINILNASILAMHKAIDLLKVRPEYLLIDGNKFKPYGNIPHICQVKGDGRFQSIAAASVLAKTHRDDYMITLHSDFPAYQWNQNKGYPTKKHIEAIVESGITEHHRISYKPNYQLQLKFR